MGISWVVFVVYTYAHISLERSVIIGIIVIGIYYDKYNLTIIYHRMAVSLQNTCNSGDIMEV